MPRYLGQSVFATPTTLFDATAAGATLSKLVWPGSYTNTLPGITTGLGGVAAVTSGGATIGGIFSPDKSWDSVLLNFAAVGAADETLVVEIGRLFVSGAIVEVLSSASLKSITTSGTLANVNPYTGAATAGVTWRMFDLITLTNRGNFGQVLTDVGGTENNTPGTIILSVTDAAYYYVLVTSLGALTRATCVMTPVA